ncbi:putative gustatory receptor 93c [Zeugodacus cucurbitae]|uniref:putative gustatory receptor 93c n=1 Tax=Zeugodacus cucurbitae TaxID=28588 RepID=UPI0023D96C23|nr:putative gustatory receptor 93c [Zeugodacus cucurbitae]
MAINLRAINWRAATVKVMLLSFFYYARLCGVCAFTYRKTPNEEAYETLSSYSSNTKIYTVKQCKWYKWFFGILRMLGAIGYIYGTLMMWYTADHFYNLITFLQTNLMASGSVIMSISFLLWGEKFAHNINYFLCIFRRAQALDPQQQVMGLQQLTSLLIINICVLNAAWGFLVILDYTDWREFAVVVIKLYLEIGIVLSLHIVSIGYMCVGSLYTYMNRYMREDLLPRARSLDYVLRRNKSYCSQRYARKLIRLTRELNNCASIYNDIYQVATTFHQNIRFQILFALMFDFSLLTTIMYSILYLHTVVQVFDWDAVVFCIQIIIEVLIMILSAYSAVQGGLGANKLSLDSVYMGGDTEWNRSVSFLSYIVEIFINRMNLYEFKPNVLGFFDISSDILVMFLSASVTYLTYILQNTKLNQQ